MFYYIDRLCTPSFPIVFVKTKSDFIVGSVEIRLGNWTLVVTVLVLILFWLSQTWPVNLRIQEWVFSGCTVPPDSKETELGNSGQEASPSAGKNTGIVLVPSRVWKCVPKAVSGDVDISKVPGCHLLWQMSSQWGSQKFLQGLVSHELTTYLSIFDKFLTQRIMAILSKGSKPDKFEPHISLKLSLRIFKAFVPVLLSMNLFLNQTLVTFLLYVRQTWMTQLILAISLRGVIFL